MPYALSFSEEFFVPAGDLDSIAASNRPTSVYQAILSLSDAKRREIAQTLFRRRDIDPLDLFDAVRSTNTCSDLDSPVRVWIDPRGIFDLLVFDDAPVEN